MNPLKEKIIISNNVKIEHDLVISIFVCIMQLLPFWPLDFKVRLFSVQF